MIGLSPKTGSNMGYYTYFSLDIKGDPEEVEKVQNFHVPDDDTEFSDPFYINGILDEARDHDYKWYDWEKDMKKLARKFPNVLFILDGDGEESNDNWQFRIKGDICEHHYVELPPFTTPELLTEKEKQNNN